MYFDRIGQLLLVVFFTMPLVTVQAANQYSVHQKLAALEASSGGRLGISSIDTTNDQRIQYHADHLVAKVI